MNEETFLAGLRDLAELPVPGPLPEQRVIARGRVARRRRAARRTAAAAAAAVLVIAAAVGVPSGFFTALDPARRPAPLTNGDTIVSQWSRPVGTLAGDTGVTAALLAKGGELLPGRPADVRLLVATDLDHERVALVAAARRSGGYDALWLAGPPGTRPGRLRPWPCTGLVLCTLPVRADGWPGLTPAGGSPEELNAPLADEVTREVVAATLAGADVTASAADVDATGRAVAAGLPVGEAGVPGLFRVTGLLGGPLRVTAARGGGTARAAVAVGDQVNGGVFEELRRDLEDPSLRGGGDRGTRQGAADAKALRLLLAEVLRATQLPHLSGIDTLYASRRGAHRLVVLAVQSPSKGWVVVPADVVQAAGAEPSVTLQALIPTPPGGPSVRGFAWRTRTAPDRVTVLGPRSADVAEVTGSSDLVRLRLVDGHAEGVVPGADRVRFLGDRGVAVGETVVAPLLPRDGTLLP